jgi:hypothetical protein
MTIKGLAAVVDGGFAQVADAILASAEPPESSPARQLQAPPTTCNDSIPGSQPSQPPRCSATGRLQLKAIIGVTGRYWPQSGHTRGVISSDAYNWNRPRAVRGGNKNGVSVRFDKNLTLTPVRFVSKPISSFTQGQGVARMCAGWPAKSV